MDLSNKASDFRFVTRKWNIVNDQLNMHYSVANKIIYSTKVLNYNLCDLNGPYNLVRGNITVVAVLQTHILSASEKLMEQE